MFKKNQKRAPINNFQLQILRLLKYRPMYGYEILNIFEQKGWRPSTGTLYPALKKLEKKEYIESYKSKPDRGKKKRANYKLTKKGFDYVQNTYSINVQHPELYIKPFFDVWNKYFKEIIPTKILLLDFMNFINPEKIFRVLFTQEPPSNVKFEKVYDFNLENPKSRIYDHIFLFLPFFFTYRELSDNPSPNHLKILEDVKAALKLDGRILIVDFLWTKHAIIDVLSFLVTGEVTQIAYTEEEIQNILRLAGFKNIQTLKKHRGIIVLLASNFE
ncbi:MAG: PadR family transcriptional regulator [Candidatus Helarchaeota archaeon]